MHSHKCQTHTHKQAHELKTANRHKQATHLLGTQGVPSTIFSSSRSMAPLVSVQAGHERLTRALLPYKQNNSHFSLMTAITVSSLGNTSRGVPLRSSIFCMYEVRITLAEIIVYIKFLLDPTQFLPLVLVQDIPFQTSQVQPRA